MPKINPENIDVTIGTTYPQPLDEPCKTRVSRRLSAVASAMPAV